MADVKALKASNEQRWKNAKLTRNFVSIARSLVNAKSRYVDVQNRTGVPWFIIAVIHEREASQRWNTQLGQGDPLDRVSVHVPKGRGPFLKWEDGAVDALVNCAPYAARNKDWSFGGALTLLEEYNGLGYAARGRPSPYVWAGTDQYTSGKFIKDGEYDPTAIDTQPGCANLLMSMRQLDPSITFVNEAPKSVPPVVVPSRPPVQQQPSFWTLILSIIQAIFKRR